MYSASLYFRVNADCDHHFPQGIPLYRVEGSHEVNEIEVYWKAMFMSFLDNLPLVYASIVPSPGLK